ncbi:MAG: lipopolysaccharide exporter, partial [Solirubrobacteraceae bacterium]|nr:lipopolysaccharide exporter [Solirubrobacteraceae bacterium]
ATRRKIVRVHAATILPLLGLYIALAPWAVPVVFGEQWSPAIVPSQILAVAGMVAAIVTGLGPMMMAVGRPGALLAFNTVACAIYATMVFLLAPLGIIAVSIGVAGFHLVTLAASQYLLLDRICGIRTRDTAAEIGPAILATAVTTAITAAAANALDPIGVPPVAVVCIAGLAGAGAFCWILRAAFPDLAAEMISLVRRVLPSRLRAPSRLRPAATPAPQGRA